MILHTKSGFAQVGLLLVLLIVGASAYVLTLKNNLPSDITKGEIINLTNKQDSPPSPKEKTDNNEPDSISTGTTNKNASPTAVLTPPLTPTPTLTITHTPSPTNTPNPESDTISQTLVIYPGYNLLSFPVSFADNSIQAVIGTQLNGTDFDSGDRVLKWQTATQTYERAVYIDGTWYNADNYPNGLSTITFSPHEGFWIENKSGENVQITISGSPVAESLPVLTVSGGDWQLVGTTYLQDLALESAGFSVTGTNDPATSDRFLFWDPLAQEGSQYETAWFCDGEACQDWGEPWYQHWLANDYSQSEIVIGPWTGFWFQGRSSSATTDSAPQI